MPYISDISGIASESYDVIVVGGGLAGSVAAQYAVKNGARTIIFERDPVIGTPVRCGEGVSERGIKPYAPVDGPYVANRLKGVEFIAPDGQSVTIESDIIGMILDRSIFDKYLGDKAANTGADIVTSADVTGLLYSGDRPSGVQVQYHGKSYDISGRIIIGADGVESRVGRWAGLKTMTKFNNMESAVQVVVTGETFYASRIKLFFGRKVAPGGYAWVFPKSSSAANVGLAISGNYARERSAESYLNEFLEKHYNGCTYSPLRTGGVPCNPPLKKMAEGNVICAGDAGHTVNPLTGGGIATALCSGRIAGEVAAEAVRTAGSPDAIVKTYTKKWYRSRGRDMKRFTRLSNYVAKLEDKQFNDLARLLNEIPREEWSMLKIFMFALRNKPELILDAIKVYKDF